MKKILISGIIGSKVKPIDVRVALEEAKGEAVEIEISSEGGSVFAGVEIFNLIKNYPGKTTTKIT
ncbi:ATP-dependent Clp protease proteolytic subunit, partial [Candidatus Babeliales bacterium]|nr:ATP-dependent Clp protease proteolytic subunit [Candidatus Babeliales bacterium]